MRIKHLTLILVTIINVGTLRAELFTDNFDDGFLDPDFWQITADELGTVSEEHGVLGFTIDAGPPASEAYAELRGEIVGISTPPWIMNGSPRATPSTRGPGCAFATRIPMELLDGYTISCAATMPSAHFHMSQQPRRFLFQISESSNNRRTTLSKGGSELRSYIWLAGEWSYFETRPITAENVTVDLFAGNWDSVLRILPPIHRWPPTWTVSTFRLSSSSTRPPSR